MVNKRKLHHWLGVVRRLKIWQLVLLLLLMSFVSAYLLRQNNLGMLEHRTAVKRVDRENGDVQKALVNLQRYVSAHMNTSLGDRGIYLEDTYQRAYDKVIDAAAVGDNPNTAVYQQASIECRNRFAGGTASFRNDYVTCVIEKVGSVGGANDPLAALKPPSPDLYRYNFISPLWTPDLAGFSVLITTLLLLVIAAKIAFTQVVYFVLRRRRH